MSILLVSYIINSLLLGVLGYLFFLKYRNLSGIFFLFFTIATSLWFIFFILTYFSTSNLEVILIFTKLAFFLSIISLYSFILFIFYFQKKKSKVLSPLLIGAILIWSILGYVYLSTPYIIEGLYFDTEYDGWYELEGVLYNFHLIISLLFLPLAIGGSIFRLKKLTAIDKRRFQYILLGMITFVVLTFLFLLILPLFGIWAMERYIGFFFLPFIFSVFYSIRNYNFLNIRIILIKAVVFIYSMACAVLLGEIVRKYISYLSNDFRTYWGVSSGSILFEVIVGIVAFIIIYNFVGSKIFPFFNKDHLFEKLEKMKERIPYITDIDSLNIYLKKQFSYDIKIDYVHMNTSVDEINREVLNFFNVDIYRRFLINDIVFVEENKNKFTSLDEIKKLDPHTYIIFPIRNTKGGVLGVFQLGRKPMGDPFLTDEIEALRNFIGFLSSHLKYIAIYQKINDLNINLDKKVDEKTIEYNNLINKQKEFIAFISHEIKNPVTNAMFLCDSIVSDIKASKQQTKIYDKFQEDIHILNTELLKIGDLTKKIFSVEKHDLEKVTLFKEHTPIYEFLREEIEVFQKKYPHVSFESEITDIGNHEIDRVQMRQVFHNLVENAVKFADITSPKVYIGLVVDLEGVLSFSIQDNGSGLKDIDISQIFDRYATGNSSMVGIGLGLYLCKRIVELHGWSISASHSKRLGGACFTIS